jgi:hypothetical protein
MGQRHRTFKTEEQELEKSGSRSRRLRKSKWETGGRRNWETEDDELEY